MEGPLGIRCSQSSPGDVERLDDEPGTAFGSELALHLCRLGQQADVIFGAGGKTGNGALIETAGNPGLFCIGVDTDQWDTVPEAQKCLVSSATKAITPSIVALIKTVKDGTFPSGNYIGGSALAPFHAFETVVTQEIKDKLAAGLKAYEANEITLP